MLGNLTGKPFNRASRIHAKDIARAGTIVEAISFIFPAEASEEDRKEFEGAWNQILTRGQLGDIRQDGNWLEKAVPRYNPNGPDKSRLEADRKLATSQPGIYLSLLVWNIDTYNVSDEDKSIEKLELQKQVEKLSTLWNFSISKITIQLQEHSPSKLDPPSPVRDLVATSTASLLVLPITRRYNPEKTVLRTFDFVAHEQIKDVRARKRPYPPPYGNCWPMGDINQYSIPTLPSQPSFSYQSESVWDVIWLHIRENALDDYQNLMRQLHAHIQTETACEVVRWCFDEQDKDQIAVIICWKAPSSRLNTLSNFQAIVAELSALQLTAPPRFQTFPSFFPLQQEGWIEIITFHVPTGDLDRLLFQRAFYAFQKYYPIRSRLDTPTNYLLSTTIPGGAGVDIPTAVQSPFFGGWEDANVPLLPPFKVDGESEIVKFTTVFRWESAEAREQWYRDFSSGCIGSYERLGWMIDLLKILTVVVESTFLRLESLR